MKFNLKVLAFSVLVATIALVGCGKNDQGAGGAGAGAGAAQQMPPATVEVQTVSLRSIPVVKSFSGRVTAVETSEVRPQVTGIIESVAFQEGSYVKAGQELYRLNRDNYISAANSSIAAIQTAEASLISARASLAAQEATLAQARADLARVESLVGIDAVSKQLYDQHKTAVRTAQANVEAAKATVNQANASINSAKANRDASQLDMSRTIIRAPISGKIGISAVTAGALVSASQVTPLATISRTDMVYVDISQSSSELLRLRQQMASGQASEGSTEVQIVLEDGETYPLIGRLALSDASVDEATGAVKLRAVFPNPDGLLIPGMYVNANLAQSVVHNAMLLPQTAIIRTPKGETQVYVVNQNKQIEVRNVKTAGTFQGQWVVTDGLTNGDNVVVVGGAKVKPEQAVETRPYSPNGQNPQGVGQAPAQGPVQNPNQAPSQAPQQSKTSQQGRQEQQAPTAPTQNRAPTDDSAEQAEAQAMADAADEVAQ
ncbi:efflux RND transporter periplasmic adaptor subunit [Moraxella bovis]|uniref:efflux RND transporter periplasmic adaptor subunit n=1 Tax=Moraxella bovis TaxID=476 RepID=UPI002226E4BD|nr:efflux RND transporter periplasmic adaptor subunit [Moraxella bovis]UYZ67751.1 efflux RND transporter periplasmic adaptor subunit [Moraxella bovis]UYZ70123.1 efflux RND transporter periplasmic adaptor subunit [Moraxella bovis]UYZ73965.1 efflux RND transporter periplasmic adaptor subunit [Moraxella bovis]UZA13414.1 efflux RND transporter periplasmic adaptor subunit [Moraxella bovis]UZA28231.1 efflux RND transporter periplasmic adaptor subunit [Moraxella bovis]